MYFDFQSNALDCRKLRLCFDISVTPLKEYSKWGNIWGNKYGEIYIVILLLVGLHTADFYLPPDDILASFLIHYQFFIQHPFDKNVSSFNSYSVT